MILSILFIAVLVAISVAVTMFACWRAISCGKRPGVWLAIASAMGTSAGLWLVICFLENGSEIFTRAYWQPGKFSAADVIPAFIGICSAFCLVPTSLVVVIYQLKWKRRRAIEDWVGELRAHHPVDNSESSH